MTRATVSHWRLMGALLAVFVLAAAVPGWAAYTKLYKITNTMTEDGQFLRVINNALEVVTTYTAYPSAWSPPAISNITYAGTYCTKMKFGEFRVDPVVAPGAYAKIGWRTADNNCRLRDLRWVKYSGATVPVVDPDQLGGVPGGGEVQYINGEYVWVLINDTDLPIDLSNVSLEVLDGEPPLEDLMQGMSLRAMRPMQGDGLPHPNIVTMRVEAIVSGHIEPLIDAVNAGWPLSPQQDGAEMQPACIVIDKDALLACLNNAIAELQDGAAAYSTAPGQAEEHWGQAIDRLAHFKRLVKIIRWMAWWLFPREVTGDWLDRANAAIAAIAALPGDAAMSGADLQPPGQQPPPPPPPGDGSEYGYALWDEMAGATLPKDSYTAFVVPDGDGVPDETLMLTTLYGDTLECVELYTLGPEGAPADTTPPVIDLAVASPATLWPPKHEMVQVQVDVTLHDLDDAGLPRLNPVTGAPLAGWYIEEVSCNEEETGDYAPDWLLDPDNDAHALSLRAEREGKGHEGRTYTVIIRAIDASGNVSDPHTLYVPVKHDRIKPSAIASLAALPAGGGVEVVFTLSSEAQVEVEVLNIAGRRVRTIVADRECEAGINSLAWNCRSDRGVMVPSGAYLVRVTARTDDGEQSSRLCTVTLRR